MTTAKTWDGYKAIITSADPGSVSSEGRVPVDCDRRVVYETHSPSEQDAGNGGEHDPCNKKGRIFIFTGFLIVGIFALQELNRMYSNPSGNALGWG